MFAKNVTLKVNADLYLLYRRYCKNNNLTVSQQFEIMMEEKVGKEYKQLKAQPKKKMPSKSKKYVGSLTGEPFMLHENKLIASMLLEEPNLKKIKNEITQENLFGYKTVKSIPKRVNSIIKRIAHLDQLLLKKIATDLSGDGRIVILYSIYMRDRLFNELLDELVAEKFSIRDFNFEKRLINKFINNKAETEQKIHDFTDETKTKLATVMYNILKDSGLIITQENSSRLNNPIISSELRNYFEEKGSSKFLKSIGVLQ